MAKKRANSRNAGTLTPRQLAALRSRVEKRVRADIEVAAGIVGWRLVSVLLQVLAHKGLLTRDEVAIVMAGAREGIWQDLPNGAAARQMLELDLADWQSQTMTAH